MRLSHSCQELTAVALSTYSPFCAHSQFKAAPLEGRASSSVTPGTASAYDRLGSGNAGNNDAGDKGNADGEGDDDDDDDDDFEAVFAAELAKEMEKMLGGLKPSKDGVEVAGSAGAASEGSEQETAEERQFRETFEKIMKDSVAGGDGAAGDEGGGDIDLDALSKLMSGLGAASANGGNSNAPASAATPKKGKGVASTAKTPAAAAHSSPAGAPASFQDTIKATMSKLAESEAQHKNRSAGKGKGGLPGVDPDDPLAALMAQMEALSAGEGGDGEDGDGDLPGLLDGLMDQLMSKELLYDPIKELKVNVGVAYADAAVYYFELTQPAATLASTPST